MNKYFLLIKRFNLRYCHFVDYELMIVAAATENAAVDGITTRQTTANHSILNSSCSKSIFVGFHFQFLDEVRSQSNR